MKKKEAIAQIENALADEINNIGTPYESLGRCQGMAIALAILNHEDPEPELDRVAGERHLMHKLKLVGGRAF